ncbi:MAG: hypothetical protein AB8B91_04520 [Rubripirellula sp.]
MEVAGRAKQTLQEVVGIDGTSFDAVLRGDPSNADGSLLDELKAGIKERLSAGFGSPDGSTNQPIEIRVTNNGLQLEGDHQRAAEIEGLLNSDPNLRELARKLHDLAGTKRLTIESSGKMYG